MNNIQLQSDGLWITDAQRNAWDEYEKRRKGEWFCYKTGIDKFDDEIGGIEPAEQIIISARPGAGKTTFALYLAQNLWRYNPNQKFFFVFFTFEVAPSRQIFKMASRNTGIPYNRLLSKGKIEPLNQREEESVKRAMAELAGFPIVFHKIRRSGKQQKAIVAGYHKQLPKDTQIVIVLDHIGLSKGEKNSDDERRIVSEASQAGIECRQEFGSINLFIAQASRKTEEKDNRPMLYQPWLSHLKESGALEEDADSVWFLHRPDYYPEFVQHQKNGKFIPWHDEPDENAYGQVRWLFAKSRYGEAGQFITMEHNFPCSDFKIL